MRAEIFKQTSFRCSAGIAHNKVLAKLCAGLNKPNKQTILTQEQVPTLFKKVNIGKVRGLVRINFCTYQVGCWIIILKRLESQISNAKFCQSLLFCFHIFEILIVRLEIYCCLRVPCCKMYILIYILKCWNLKRKSIKKILHFKM